MTNYEKIQRRAKIKAAIAWLKPRWGKIVALVVALIATIATATGHAPDLGPLTGLLNAIGGLL